ncbi:hypothetical protein [Anaerofustis stercorihominis]
MMKPVRILVCCGGGIATSSIAVALVKEVCNDININAKIDKSTINGAPAIAKNYDIALFTAKYKKPLDCPIMCVTNFITGIGLEETKKELKEVLKKLEKDINKD